MMQETWDLVRGQMQAELPRNSFSLWIEPLSFVEARENRLVLGCPNRFSRKWVSENYLGQIRERLGSAGFEGLEVVLEVRGPAVEPSSPPPSLPEQLPLPHLAVQKVQNRWFNSQFTFDRFIVGQSNEFAYSASRSMTQGDDSPYRTLLLLSATGLGKTHLSQAIGHAILEKSSKTRIFYRTAEDFTNEMISSLRANRMEEFKDRYRRACDVLLLEEIHFLNGKEKVQDELGYTLDALSTENKKIICTSALAPKDIPHLSNKLSSRLTSGLVTSIADPDYQTRTQILIRKSSDYGVPLSSEILDFLAAHLRADVRQMESALKCLKARSELLGSPINLDAAREIVAALVSGDQLVTTDKIKTLVCRYYQVNPEALSSPSRKKQVAYPRNIYAYLCRRHTQETLQKIAQTIGRSHTTVIYASEMVDKKLKTDRNMKNEVDFLSDQICSSEK